ncbi:1-phosphofructokinase family hexose kinase [Pseudothermotoga thermarum]|uniref:PfkB domain protein n=1 Tax=Pseudothermotoga thermarum DSM 5069 TaxID=688269 RepID=F7YUB2_9THEM|nr:1-phosphofructokinase family hexose kinase [Pseudothermotoga thermarum]AEH51311.1 PfkB domain protein [Pseudothermotoga thermarum DSM 5069]
MKVVTVTLNPALDREFVVKNFCVGSLHRISSHNLVRMSPGGKGINVSIALAKLRVKSVAIGILGGYIGKVLLSELNKISPLISTSFVHIEQDTRENIVIVDPENHTMTAINSPGPLADQNAVDLLLKRYKIYLSNCDTVVLSGTAMPGIGLDIYGIMTKMAKEANKVVFSEITDDYIKPTLDVYPPDVIKPDVRDRAVVLGKQLKSLEDHVEAAKELVKMGCKVVVLSYEIKNDIVATKDGVWLISPTVEVDLANLLGAGDAYVAAMVYKKLVEPKSDPIDMAKFGYAAALAKTRKPAKEMPEYSEIAACLKDCKIEKIG